MLKNSPALMLAVCLAACSKPRPVVYVNLEQVLANSFTSRKYAKLPLPPKPLSALVFSLQGAESRSLENTSSPEVLKTQEDAQNAQEQALRTIRRRLTEIYLKQVDLFARQQMELLGDVDTKNVGAILPKLHAAFLQYAGQRLPLVSRLAFLSGFPDNNPKNQGPPPSMKPVPRQKWVEAIGLRNQLNILDSEYSRKATEILAEASAQAADGRLEVLKKVDDFRRMMLNKALVEAAYPLSGTPDRKILRVEAAPQIILPAEGSQELQIPPTNALPRAPQVEFERPSENMALAKQLLERQLKIWSSINDFQVVSSPQGKASDATKEFEQWRKQQEVGP